MLKGDQEITISIERYNELLRMEFIYYFRRGQLKRQNYVSPEDEILYEVYREEKDIVKEEF